MPGTLSTEIDSKFDSYLLLEDGSIFPGKRFGANVSVDGEIGKLHIPKRWTRARFNILYMKRMYAHVHDAFGVNLLTRLRINRGKYCMRGVFFFFYKITQVPPPVQMIRIYQVHINMPPTMMASFFFYANRTNRTDSVRKSVYRFIILARNYSNVDCIISSYI